MQFTFLKTLKKLRSLFWLRSRASEQNPSDHTCSETDSLRCEAGANNELALRVTAAHGHQRNPRALQLSRSRTFGFVAADPNVESGHAAEWPRSSFSRSRSTPPR
ncbi:hypothetical protein FHY05_002220 [Sphingomonas sp. BK580]|nr:hypothetical protein [Sphingomonas sp. BK580]